MAEVTKITHEEAIKIIYYLMAVDGSIDAEEEERFDAVAKEIDSSFDKTKKQKLVEECRHQLDKAIDEEDYYDVVQEGVDEVFKDHSSNSGYSFRFLFGGVTGKLVLWNMLVIAFSDEKYTEGERKLIKFVMRKMNVDKTLFFEMENTIKAIMAIDKEEKWLKTTSRPYSVIEAHINELEDRKNVIENSAKELIAL